MKFALLFGLVALVALDGCKPQLGDTCQGERQVCSDSHTALYCMYGRMTPVACKGPRGCKLDDKSQLVDCDFSGSADGDTCLKKFDNVSVCSGDKKTLVTCADSKFVHTACPGPNGCNLQSVVSCDQTVGVVGGKCDPKEPAWKRRCTPDSKAILVCKDGKLVQAHACTGPKGCTLDAAKNSASCDFVPQVGDRCLTEDASLTRCSDDKKSILGCSFGDYAEVAAAPFVSVVGSQACPGPKGCQTVTGKPPHCDLRTRYAGAPCDSEGKKLCAEDESNAILLCKKDGGATTWQIDKACAKGCLLDDDEKPKCIP